MAKRSSKPGSTRRYIALARVVGHGPHARELFLVERGWEASVRRGWWSHPKLAGLWPTGDAMRLELEQADSVTERNWP